MNFTETMQALTRGKAEASWFLPMLLHYVEFVGQPWRSNDRDDQRLLRIANELEVGLKIHALANERYDIGDVFIDDLLTNLAELINFLNDQLREERSGGPIPDYRRGFCAAVCATAWRELHGEVQPHSPWLQDACEKYWCACGNNETSPTGRLRNWVPFLERIRDEEQGLLDNIREQALRQI